MQMTQNQLFGVRKSFLLPLKTRWYSDQQVQGSTKKRETQLECANNINSIPGNAVLILLRRMKMESEVETKKFNQTVHLL